MGYDSGRFVEEQLEDYTCGICLDVMKTPKMIVGCQHMFCDDCIRKTIDMGDCRCPFDREHIVRESIRNPIRLFQSLYDSLEIRCLYECGTIQPLNAILSHEHYCDKNPANNIFCDKDCGTKLNQSTVQGHKCADYFKQTIKSLKKEIEQLKDENNNLRKLTQSKAQGKAQKENKTPVPKQVSRPEVNKSNSLAQTKVAVSPSIQIEYSFRDRITEMIEILQQTSSSHRLQRNIPWLADPLHKALVQMTNVETIKECLKCDFRHFWGNGNYSQFFETKNKENKTRTIVDLALFEYIEPYLNSDKRVLVVQYIDHGILSWCLAKMAGHVTVVVKPESVQAHRVALQNRFPNLTKKIYYEPFKPRVEQMTFDNQFDIIVTTSYFQHHEYETLLQDYAPDGFILSFESGAQVVQKFYLHDMFLEQMSLLSTDEFNDLFVY